MALTGFKKGQLISFSRLEHLLMEIPINFFSGFRCTIHNVIFFGAVFHFKKGIWGGNEEMEF